MEEEESHALEVGKEKKEKAQAKGKAKSRRTLVLLR